MPNVAIIDYGMGNILSVQRAFEYNGAKVTLITAPQTLENFSHVVLPGVGAFPDAMLELSRQGFIPILKNLAYTGKPLMGICLGMQLLFEYSEEFNTTIGLGLIEGGVVAIPPITAEGKTRRIPHVGWRTLIPSDKRTNWENTPLVGLGDDPAMYFVHSYMAQPADSIYRIADCNYDGILISAMVQKGRIWGCQFHPEKSAGAGLELIKRFLLL